MKESKAFITNTAAAVLTVWVAKRVAPSFSDIVEHLAFIALVKL